MRVTITAVIGTIFIVVGMLLLLVGCAPQTRTCVERYDGSAACVTNAPGQPLPPLPGDWFRVEQSIPGAEDCWHSYGRGQWRAPCTLIEGG